MTDIETVLAERKTTHGDFKEHALISQSLKAVMRQSSNWEKMDPDYHESLDMIVHKIARVLAGNWTFKDHWTDIIGYAKLIEKDL